MAVDGFRSESAPALVERFAAHGALIDDRDRLSELLAPRAVKKRVIVGNRSSSIASGR